MKRSKKHTKLTRFNLTDDVETDAEINFNKIFRVVRRATRPSLRPMCVYRRVSSFLLVCLLMVIIWVRVFARACVCALEEWILYGFYIPLATIEYSKCSSALFTHISLQCFAAYRSSIRSIGPTYHSLYGVVPHIHSHTTHSREREFQTNSPSITLRKQNYKIQSHHRTLHVDGALLQPNCSGGGELVMCYAKEVDYG